MFIEALKTSLASQEYSLLKEGPDNYSAIIFHTFCNSANQKVKLVATLLQFTKLNL